MGLQRKSASGSASVWLLTTAANVPQGMPGSCDHRRKHRALCLMEDCVYFCCLHLLVYLLCSHDSHYILKLGHEENTTYPTAAICSHFLPPSFFSGFGAKSLALKRFLLMNLLRRICVYTHVCRHTHIPQLNLNLIFSLHTALLGCTGTVLFFKL